MRPDFLIQEPAVDPKLIASRKAQIVIPAALIASYKASSVGFTAYLARQKA